MIARALAGLALTLAFASPSTATCVRCPIIPPTARPLPSYGFYPAPTAGASLTASGWQTIRVEHNVSYIGGDAGLWNDDSRSLRRAFLPLTETSSLNYLYSTAWYSVTGYRWLRATLSVLATSGTPTLAPLSDCAAAPQVRLMLYTGNLYDEYGRWWSPPIPLPTPSWDAAAVVTITADLTDPAQWASVWGQSALADATATAAFERVKTGARLGLTFGTCSAGHGIGVEGGTADVRLHWYWVE